MRISSPANVSSYVPGKRAGRNRPLVTPPEPLDTRFRCITARQGGDRPMAYERRDADTALREKGQTMAETLKVGVIGVGGIAGTHFPGWKESPDAELVALADLDRNALNRVGDAQGVKRRYEKPEELMASPDIDIIDICTPN